jgi:hypothetical protein
MSDSLARRADKVRMSEIHRRWCNTCENCRARMDAKATMDMAHIHAQEMTNKYMKTLMEKQCLTPKK